MFNSGLLFCAHPELDLKPCRRGKVWIVFFLQGLAKQREKKGSDMRSFEMEYFFHLRQASVCHTLRWYQWSIKSTSITPSYLVYMIFDILIMFDPFSASILSAFSPASKVERLTVEGWRMSPWATLWMKRLPCPRRTYVSWSCWHLGDGKKKLNQDW